MFSLTSNLIKKSLTKPLFFQPLRTYVTQDPQRFFMVSYQFKEGKDSERAYHQENHLKKVYSFEDEGKILFGGPTISKQGLFLLFKCKDETVPYDFVKSDPYYVNGTVSEYKIDEVEVGAKEDVTQLAKLNQYR